MAERPFFNFWRRSASKSDGEEGEKRVERVAINRPISFAEVAGLKDVFEDTKHLRDHKRSFGRTKYDDEFDLYDEMLKLDPELNGAVRSVSLTANNWEIDYSKGKNRKIRKAIEDFVYYIDFDDILINMLRNLMVYGNDINKLVGRTGVGITKVQSLPVHQITIKDDRGIEPPSVTRESPIMDPSYYCLQEQGTYPQEFPINEIWHTRIDYRSNWFQDRLGRWSYGVWGASRFSSLKQPIRAKYNMINNRIALEEALTKQYITIDSQSVEHITDPDEQQERLSYIMTQVAELLEGLRGDQIPILPSYVEMHHVDLKNTIPDPTAFLDIVNGDISAVLQVPRVAAGQERGSTFAATYSASMWSINAIRRLQAVAIESCCHLFLKHLELLGISAKKEDLPVMTFKPIEEESKAEAMKRASIGWTTGMITKNEAREALHMEKVKGGEDFKPEPEPAQTGPNPRDNTLKQDKEVTE
tara:strand:- start:5747 stop:7162 length:1416 start_codon:yes stop_codon:yes gene_type:complete